MAQFTIQEEGTPIIPYSLLVTFPVNHSVQYIEGVVNLNFSQEDLGFLCDK